MGRALTGVLLLLVYGTTTQGQDPAGGARPRIESPAPYQVIQRQGFVPEQAHEHEPGGPQLGFGLVPVTIDVPGPMPSKCEYRVVRLDGAYGRGTEWAELATRQDSPKRIQAQARVPAGGWYRLELRWLKESQVTETAAVEPVGVGEVFVIAGQSYAEGANDAHLRVEDPPGRVVALDIAKGTWGIANDPQPAMNNGGTIWPPFGNALLPMVRVPVGLVNVAVGGTSSRQWLPGTPLYERLKAAGKAAGRFRAVLWQQGESDVIERVSAETYVANIQKIREGLAHEWGFAPPWLLAKSTLHPTVYNDPAQEGVIRTAIGRLWSLPGFRRGPDTDILDGENRGPVGSRQHFSEIGQRRAGLLWFASVWEELHREAPHLKTP